MTPHGPFAAPLRRHAVCLVTVCAAAGAALLAAADAAENEETRALELEIREGFPEAVGGQQGIATDGTHVFVQSTHELVKHDLQGKVVAKSGDLQWHHGGIEYHDGRIYAAVSECSAKGTRLHWVYVYDAQTLEKIAEHDVGRHFTVCAGGIAYYDGHFYVAESYYDNDHNDYVVKFDRDFKFVASYRIDFKCPYGIQGLDYLPDRGKFMVNSHGPAFYLIDTDFLISTIEPGRAPFELQDVAYVKPGVVVLNDRDGKRVVFAGLE